MDRHISVQGIGESAAVPDKCNIDLRVWATGRTVAESTEQMATASRAVIDALAGGGADEVSTARFSIRSDHDNQGRPSGFRSETSIRAVTSLEGGSGEAPSRLLGAAVAAGGDNLALDGMEFVQTDLTKVEEEAGRAAIADARARAEVMAEAAGVGLGDVLAIEQQPFHAPGPLRFKAMSAEAMDMPVRPGAKTTTVEVRVTYSLA
jgi:hypothetical protein